MLNEQKVKMMTRMAIYDKEHSLLKKGAAKSFKTDYVTFGILRTIFTVTIAFAVCVAMYVLYNADVLMENINSLDYMALGRMFLGYYCVFVVIYIVIALFYYSYKYDKSKAEIRKYYSNLKRLERFSER